VALSGGRHQLSGFIVLLSGLRRIQCPLCVVFRSAHVMTLRENDYRSYITRMCKSCNGRNGLMDMKFDAGLAVAREKWRRG